MKVPFLVVPSSILAAAAAGLWSSFLFAIPSLTLDFPPPDHAVAPGLEQVSLLVEGVRCVDTAARAASTLEDLPGIRRFVAYASRARVEVQFDPQRVSRPEIVEALEGPVLMEPDGEYRFGVYRVLEVDGAKMNR